MAPLQAGLLLGNGSLTGGSSLAVGHSGRGRWVALGGGLLGIDLGGNGMVHLGLELNDVGGSSSVVIGSEDGGIGWIRGTEAVAQGRRRDGDEARAGA